MADLITVKKFVESADLNAQFIKRVEVAVYEAALALREGMGATLTEEQQEQQRWALRVLDNQEREARRMLPALAIKANDNGFIDANGILTATDAQIRTVVTGLTDEYSNYIAALAV